MRSCSWSHLLAHLLKSTVSSIQSGSWTPALQGRLMMSVLFWDKKSSASSGPETYSKSAFQSPATFYTGKAAEDLSCFQICCSKPGPLLFWMGCRSDKELFTERWLTPPSCLQTLLISEWPDLLQIFSEDQACTYHLYFAGSHTLNYIAMLKYNGMKIYLSFVKFNTCDNGIMVMWEIFFPLKCMLKSIQGWNWIIRGCP